MHKHVVHTCNKELIHNATRAAGGWEKPRVRVCVGMCVCLAQSAEPDEKVIVWKCVNGIWSCFLCVCECCFVVFLCALVPYEMKSCSVQRVNPCTHSLLPSSGCFLPYIQFHSSKLGGEGGNMCVGVCEHDWRLASLFIFNALVLSSPTFTFSLFYFFTTLSSV